MLADVLSQINGGSTLPRRWRQTLPTLTPKWQRFCATSGAGQAQGDPPGNGSDQG